MNVDSLQTEAASEFGRPSAFSPIAVSLVPEFAPIGREMWNDGRSLNARHGPSMAATGQKQTLAWAAVLRIVRLSSRLLATMRPA